MNRSNSFRMERTHVDVKCGQASNVWALVAVSFALFAALVLHAQQATAQAALDEVSQRASQWEAELGKYNDSTAEAADVMVKLVELYHQDARVFGLVRVGNRFVATHPNDPRHPDVMLKTIDGLQAMSRNNDLIVACRQFLFRYPDSPACPEVEVRLADTLAQGDDKKAAAAAYHAIWKRQGNTDIGLRSAIRAIQRYTSMGNDQIALGAELAEELLAITSGSLARDVGMHSVNSWARVGKWAESNRAAGKLLSKKVLQDPARRRSIHMQMADNYNRLGQHANSARSYSEARKIEDDQQAHYNLIDQLDRGKASSREIQSVAKEYATKYPDRDDRFRGLSVLAQAYLRENNPGAAITLLGRVLSFDAMTNDSGRVYVDRNGTEPERLAESEKVLRDAISKNKKQAAYLRYVLAFSLYRDRMKDTDKTRAVLRELIDQSPTDDHYTRGALNWLLDNARDEAEFDAEVARIVEARRRHPELSTFAKYLSDWRQAARRNANRKDRARRVEQAIKQAESDVIASLAAKQSFRHSKQEAQVRDKLLADNNVGKLNDEFINRLLDSQGYYYRHYVGSNQRKQSAEYYGKLAKRLPKDFDAARRWLESATDYATPEVAAEAALHTLGFPPQDSGYDVWRRLMVAADKNKDAGLARKSIAWIIQSQSKFGRDPRYASFIGDVLERLELKEEAQKYWTTYLTHDRTHSESRECASRLMRLMDESQHLSFIQSLLQHDTPFQGRYATWAADEYLKARDLANFASTLKRSREIHDQNPLQPWDLDIWRVFDWVNRTRGNTEVDDQYRRQVYQAVKAMDYGSPSAAATLAILEMADAESPTKMGRILAHQNATRLIDNNWNGWDALFPYAQAAITRRDYMAAATIASGLLANIPRMDERRLKSARDIVTQSYARMGSIGLTIDEDSPIAPLLQAALYLRLGDEKLALATYDENRELFDEHRDELPIDLISFVCRRRITAGGDANHEYVEDVLRGWMVKNSESAQVDDDAKAEIQLLLATNYFKSRRYDVARSEFTTTINRYPDSQQAVEARFGIAESFMEQKVYDQAELVLEELTRSHEMDIVVRAEFLRGVLAFRRGDRDDAREIFRSVLERVPNVDLANQALFNLSEVYGSEERYIDQLNLLRTVGRLGRKSTRLHAPGLPLSIVVHDSDLGISRGHNKIPVIVTTKPSGDSERVMLTSTGAGRGLFRADVDTRLGDAQPNDKVLQLVGGDTIECDYPEEFKSEFKRVPLSDVEIRIASSAQFKAASSKVTDEEEETFSQQIVREAAEEAEGTADLRVSQQRPDNQIKPGNDVYMRVIDPDRDLTSDRDQIPIKMVADSGDNLQAMLTETGPHTGVFEGSAKTAELPAGALASDTAINHSPLMAIDLDPKSYWLAEPDGATPKSLTVDMKDLRNVARVRMLTPDAETSAPVRADLFGSHDGEFWFRLAGHPRRERAALAVGEFGRMKQRVYAGKYHGFTRWYQVVDLGTSGNALETKDVDTLQWSLPEEDENAQAPHAVIWSGKLVQRRPGAARINVQGYVTALAIGETLELPLARGNQSVDVWLKQGTHDLTIFSATPAGTSGMQATIARANLDSARVSLEPFRATDFDLTDPVAQRDAPTPAIADPIVLDIRSAKLNKASESFGDQVSDEKKPLLSHWTSLEDTASWEVTVQKPGAYEVWLNCAHPGEGSRMDIEVASQSIAANVPDTRDWTRFQEANVATVLFERPGKHQLTLRPTNIASGGLMDLKSVSLRPASGPAVIVGKTQWDFRFPSHELRYARLVFNEYLGESVAVNHIEIGGEDIDQTYIPTKQDVLALATNDALEIAAGDTVTATYTDEFTNSGNGSSQLLTSKLTATYNNAEVRPITYEFTRGGGGQVSESRLELKRIDAGERVIVEIRDYDQDRTNERDEIEFEVFVNDEEPLKLTATETEEYSGIFTKEVDTAATREEGKLTVAPGDRVYLRYYDQQNTFPGHSVPRESVVYVTEPTDGRLQILESRTMTRSAEDLRPPTVQVTAAPEGRSESLVALDAPLTVEVIDPDCAKNSGSTVKVALLTTDGSAVIVECVVSSAFSQSDGRTRGGLQQALEEGRFVGQVTLQLGGKSSPQLIPRSPQMPRNLIGTVLSADKSDGEDPRDIVVRVLNLSGKDSITAAYNDKTRADGKPLRLTANAKLVSDGVMMISDREYKEPIESLHVGERIYFSVHDPDQDVTDERDTISIAVSTEFGERETLTLAETLTHSGVFTGSFPLRASEAPTPANADRADPAIECYFGDKITATYSDPIAASQSETLEVKVDVPVVVGTDGLVSAFTKTFNDETLAVETKFRIAESYFELFKSHKNLERSEEQKQDLEAGRRVLREVMEDYPDPKYAPRISYLLGQFAQELEQWNEAIKSYELIIRRFPDHTLAADARYKLAQSYEEAGDFDEALEAYVTLAATHPKSPLIASVMIRISDYFYKNEEFEIAAQVGEKFGERFEGHEHAAEMAFRVGQCYYKTEDYQRAGLSFDEFAKQFPDDELGADSLFWSGEAYRLANNNSEAFRRYNRCRWDYPESEAAKYARGRLALPEMLQQFEAEANSVDDE